MKPQPKREDGNMGTLGRSIDSMGFGLKKFWVLFCPRWLSSERAAARHMMSVFFSLFVRSVPFG